MKKSSAVVSKDKLYEESSDVANVKESKPSKEDNEIRSKAKKWSETADAAYVNLAGCLHDIRYGKREIPLYRKWGFNTFREYVEGELAFSLRKAEYLINVWEHYVVKLGHYGTDVLDKVQHLGFTKLRECIGIFDDKEKVDEVVKKVEGLSIRKVIELKQSAELTTSESKKSSDESSSDKSPDELEIDETPAKTTKMSFKLYPDQIKEVNSALELAGARGNTQCNNQKLLYISREFLSSHSTGDGKNAKVEACKLLERQHGVKLLAIDPRTDTVLYGDDLAKSVE